MQRRNPGKSGLKVSAAKLGFNNFGGDNRTGVWRKV